MSDQMLRLYSDGLLSKWGFNDGDEPDDLLDWLEAQDPPVDYPTLEWYPVLRQLVRERLLPLIEQDLDVYDIETIHNPIRTRTVNGVPINDYGPSLGVALTPEYVDVPFADVLAAIRSLGASAAHGASADHR